MQDRFTVQQIATITGSAYRTVDDTIRRHGIEAAERVGAVRRYDHAAISKITDILQACAAKREKRKAVTNV
jgi:hypothetical protein